MTTSICQPVLAFDTATPTARVAIVSPAGECLVLRERTAARHSANLLASCDEVLREVGVGVAGLGAIVCGAGPGSFTGLRVGLAVAKGLALPTGLPLVLVSSLDALACDLADRAPQAAMLLPCLDAGKGQVYARLYSTGNPPRPVGDADWAVNPDDLVRLTRDVASTSTDPTSAASSIVIGGTGLDRYQDVFAAGMGSNAILPMMAGPSARAVARLGLARLARGEHDDIETAVPRYGRPPDITKPKRALLL